jgi:hypothetical protein
VKTYQIYSVDRNGAILGDRTIEAENHQEAVFAVRSMQRTLDTQIWHLDHRVATVPGKPAIPHGGSGEAPIG